MRVPHHVSLTVKNHSYTLKHSWGWEVLEGLIKLYNYYIMIGGGGAVIFIMLYLFDFTYWDEGFWLFLKNVLLALGGFLLVVGALMATKDYPGMPPLLFMLMTPLILYNMKIRIYPDVSPCELLAGTDCTDAALQ